MPTLTQVSFPLSPKVKAQLLHQGVMFSEDELELLHTHLYKEKCNYYTANRVDSFPF